MTGRGTVVVAGRSYQVTRLELRRGLLWITATGRGPNPDLADEPTAVFGGDGQEVCQGWYVSIPATAADVTVTIMLPLRIAEIESAREPPPGVEQQERLPVHLGARGQHRDVLPLVAGGDDGHDRAAVLIVLGQLSALPFFAGLGPHLAPGARADKRGSKPSEP